MGALCPYFHFDFGHLYVNLGIPSIPYLLYLGTTLIYAALGGHLWTVFYLLITVPYSTQHACTSTVVEL